MPETSTAPTTVAEHRYVVATTARPIEFNDWLKTVREFLNGTYVELLAYIVVDGPGCNNQGIIVKGTELDADHWVGQIVKRFGPMTKWANDVGGLTQVGDYYMDVS